MKPEAAVLAVLMFTFSLYTALFFNDTFTPILFWLFGVTVCIVGLIVGDEKVG